MTVKQKKKPRKINKSMSKTVHIIVIIRKKSKEIIIQKMNETLNENFIFFLFFNNWNYYRFLFVCLFISS